jgi:hypothetical protein
MWSRIMTVTPIVVLPKGTPQNAEKQNAVKLLAMQNGDRHTPRPLLSSVSRGR